jgi:hypothetical protein
VCEDAATLIIADRITTLAHARHALGDGLVVFLGRGGLLQRGGE